MVLPRFSIAAVLSFLFMPCLLIAQPKLDVVGGTKLDFGDLYTGNSHKHNVVLRNVGTETLIISRDRKSTRLNSSHIQKSRMPSSA